MSRNSIGRRLVLSSFGESHGKSIGAVLDGCPAGMELDTPDIQHMLDQRRPGQNSISTQRKESDAVEIITGVYRGRTTGAPITMLVKNSDQRSGDYNDMQTKLRPGHSDYTAMIKYGRFNDHRGGGRFSGRLTATHVMGGAIARKLLKEALGVETHAFTQQIGRVSMRHEFSDSMRDAIYGNDVRCPDPDTADEMRSAILEAKRMGDSLGGIIQSITTNVPIGLGEPIFGSLESDLSSAMFSIPSVKGVEFGSGFAGSEMFGSENNDLYDIAGHDDDHNDDDDSNSGLGRGSSNNSDYGGHSSSSNDNANSAGSDKRIVTRTNNSGGILGGISNGMPITMRVAFKPASSIAIEQETVDVSNMSKTTMRVKGRHDPCVVPRAPPVVVSLVSLVLADHALTTGHIGQVLS